MGSGGLLGFSGSDRDAVDEAEGRDSGRATGATSERRPLAGLPPEYVAPAHGDNPHGQGSVGTVDLSPEDSEPLEYDAGGASEEAVVGQARGEQNGDDYHGHITIAALLGNEILGVDTEEGESANGPLEPLQENLLDAICDGSGDQICLEVLRADSETNETGSTNSFAVADATIGGEEGIQATVAESNGNISDDGSCQTSTGNSTVADADVGGEPLADALQSGSESEACTDGSESVEQDHFVLGLGGEPIPIPPGCETGEPNTVFDIALLAVVCGADESSDSGSHQMDAPYGIREAAAVFALPVVGEILKATTAASESHAAAPAGEPPTKPKCPPDCPEPPEPPEPPEEPEEPEEPGPPGGPTAGPGEELPFTGADAMTMLIVGLGVMGTGLALMGLADQWRRRTRRISAG